MGSRNPVESLKSVCHLLKERTVRGEVDLLCAGLHRILLAQRTGVGQACGEDLPGTALGPIIPVQRPEWHAEAVHFGSWLQSG